ncbi:exodeoxyribonuclease VII large subunit [Methylocella sp.]|uniref:exodeoxyribonuclease VII large subunit n=1 Tax=Methylocella sp. TaxID=1978226 RepID=UPI0035B02ED0
MPDSPASNAPDFTVSELSSALKRTIEDRFGHVRLRGEISNYRGPHSSGHAYFCLKDASARIDAVIWKGTFARLRTRPQEGLEVVATGKITTFAGKSSYQIVVESLEPAGVGALMALFEERRRRLAAEGLFDEARKKPLPFLPKVVGVVTSPTGAVIRDILHRLADRFPRRVLLWPARMQGETSAAEVAAAIAGFCALPEDGPIPRPDVLIVARGGGSLEDLWSFNEEIVARAAAASAIPLISAVGHETDWTLIDFVADHRAPTPTGAAERAVPVRRDLLARLDQLARRREDAAFRFVERRRSELRGLARALPGADALLAPPRQRLDHAGRRLEAALARGADARRLALARLGQRLARQSPRARLARTAEQIAGLGRRLRRAVETRRERRADALRTLASRLGAARAASVRAELLRAGAERRRLGALEARLRRAFEDGLRRRRADAERLDQLRKSFGYENVLARGFALVRDGEGRLLRRAVDVRDGMALRIAFADGERGAVAGERGPPVDARPAPRRQRSEKPDQGSLF